ncbi:MAG: FHA domain-containing protein [Acidobacteriota bacterium]
MWRLRATGGEQQASLSFRLRAGHIKTVGRAPRADFIVDAPLVSRLHCRLSVAEDGTVHVEDLGSTNGTWINGEQITTAILRDGHLLRVGRVEFVLERQATGDGRPATGGNESR